MTARKFDAILFDLGDTLLYFDGDWSEVFSMAQRALLSSLQKDGLDLGPDFLVEFNSRMMDYYQERETEFIEYTTRYLWLQLLKDWGWTDTPRDVLMRALEAMYEVTQAHWIPEDGALWTLEQLNQRKYRMALVSNAADDPNTQGLVDKLGARTYFEHIVSSAAAGIRKPNPKIFWSVLESMGVPPNRAAMVGDMLGADILGARSAGIFSIWVTRRADKPANRAQRDTVIPDAEIERIDQLVGLLDRLSE